MTDIVYPEGYETGAPGVTVDETNSIYPEHSSGLTLFSAAYAHTGDQSAVNDGTFSGNSSLYHWTLCEGPDPRDFAFYYAQYSSFFTEEEFTAFLVDNFGSVEAGIEYLNDFAPLRQTIVSGSTWVYPEFVPMRSGYVGLINGPLLTLRYARADVPGAVAELMINLRTNGVDPFLLNLRMFVVDEEFADLYIDYDTWTQLGIEVDPDGTARFYVNGAEVWSFVGPPVQTDLAQASLAGALTNDVGFYSDDGGDVHISFNLYGDDTEFTYVLCSDEPEPEVAYQPVRLFPRDDGYGMSSAPRIIGVIP